MGLLDTITGGKSGEASDALKRAEGYFANLKTPTLDQLTLPELQKYVQAGIMTPAEAEAALQKGNAYNNIKVDPASMEAEIRAMNELGDIDSSDGMTNQMKAQLSTALDNVATTNRGHDAYILDQMQQKGTPTSLMGVAAMLNASGEGARNANLAATQAAGESEKAAIEALATEGNLASTIHGQQYGEEANRAAAQNAMEQWNAGALNTANMANANFTQEANRMNTGNKQDVSNQNVGLTNYRTGYNANLPQQMFNNELQKTSGMAGAAKDYGSEIEKQGSQTAALNMGLINAAANGASAFAGGGAKPPTGYNPNMTEDMLPAAHGAMVPGAPRVHGDSPKNDTVPAMLSPGEIVIPRSKASDPEAAKRFVTHLMKNKPIRPAHPDDVRSVLDALTSRRG